jgi:hypothetical protein
MLEKFVLSYACQICLSLISVKVLALWP